MIKNSLFEFTGL